MKKLRKKRGVISIYAVFSLIFVGFVTISIFKYNVDEIKVRAITVNDDGGSDYLKIQDAIDNATSGETIYVWAGTYFENIIINKSVTIIGNGTINTTIDGGEITDVVIITADFPERPNGRSR